MFSVIFVIEHVFLVMSYLQNVMHILFWFLNLTWKHYENSYYTCNNLRNLEKQRIFVCVCVCVCVCVLIFSSTKTLKESGNGKIKSAHNLTLLKYNVFVYNEKTSGRK